MGGSRCRPMLRFATKKKVNLRHLLHLRVLDASLLSESIFTTSFILQQLVRCNSWSGILHHILIDFSSSLVIVTCLAAFARQLLISLCSFGLRFPSRPECESLTPK